MRLQLLALFSFISLTAFSQGTIDYKVFYDAQLAKNGLRVEVAYTQKKASDSILFFYNNSVWGEEDVFKSLELRQEDNPGITFRLDPKNNLIRVRHPYGKKAVLVYRVRQDFKDPNYQALFRPVVKDHFFHVLGQSLFAIPDYFAQEASKGQVSATVEWVGFPDKFKLHNTFATQAKKQVIHARIWDEFYKSLFVGGDYRIYDFKHQDKPVYFAIREKWHGLTDDYLFDNVKKAIQSQRDFWKDYSQDYFTIIMTPTVTQNDSLYKGEINSGTALKNGFMILSTNNPFNSKEVYRHVLHHELMHHWIGGKIPNKYGQLNYWFSEGFTDYYTYKNRLRIGDITLDEWRGLFNSEVVAAHWKNPERNIPNYRIKDDFWKSRDVEKVAYRRGALFAFWLDNQILLKSKSTRSLDDLMRDILALCANGGGKFSDEMLLDKAKEYVGSDIAYFFQKHAIDGQDIDLVGQKWIDGFRFTLQDGIPQLEADEGSRARYILP